MVILTISHTVHIHFHKQHLGSSDSQSRGHFWFKTEITRLVQVDLIALPFPQCSPSFTFYFYHQLHHHGHSCTYTGMWHCLFQKRPGVTLTLLCSAQQSTTKHRSHLSSPYICLMNSNPENPEQQLSSPCVFQSIPSHKRHLSLCR